MKGSQKKKKITMKDLTPQRNKIRIVTLRRNESDRWTVDTILSHEEGQIVN